MPNNDYLDFLAHHGILGQKWGVRRYQNPDGSLTADGRRRYLKQEQKRYIDAFQLKRQLLGKKLSKGSTKRANRLINAIRSDPLRKDLDDLKKEKKSRIKLPDKELTALAKKEFKKRIPQESYNEKDAFHRAILNNIKNDIDDEVNKDIDSYNEELWSRRWNLGRKIVDKYASYGDTYIRDKTVAKYLF